MIMAAPLPSGVLQNEQIFLPLTDLDYRKHDLRAHDATRPLVAHVERKHKIYTNMGDTWLRYGIM